VFKDNRQIGEFRGAPVPLLVFGETLYDCFADGRRVLGGAPFNVAWGLRGFGRDPLLVSAVGEDADGEGVRSAMEAWGLRTDGVGRASSATGVVEVRLEGGEASYEICMPRAWDEMEDEGWGATELLYHGLLALRSERSRRTFEAIAGRSAGQRFFDVNLRPPHDGRELLERWMRGADWLKLNVEELRSLLGDGSIGFGACEGALDRLREDYGIGTVLLTAGAEGLRTWGAYGNAVCAPAPKPAALVDTVGAGDSISAVAIDGILRGASATEIVERAGAFASKICGLHGATILNREFYRHE
jgi:fructokinase